MERGSPVRSAPDGALAVVGVSRLLYILAVLFLGQRFLDDVRRIWRLYTEDRAPIRPQADDYLPTWLEAMYR